MGINKKEKKRLIKNSFEEIKDNNPDIFSIVCYYLEKNLIKIIIRRLDSDSGWGKDVRIKLYENTKQSEEIISLGSSDENVKKIEVYTHTELIERESPPTTSLRNTLSLFYFPNDDEKQEYYSTFEYLQDYYPDLNILYCDELFRREYISSKKPQYLEIYEKIANIILQKQFFVLIYIYEEGGIFVRDIGHILPYVSDGKKLCLDIYQGYSASEGFVEKCDLINNHNLELIQQFSYICINSKKNKTVHHYFEFMIEEINKKPGYYLFNNSFSFDRCKIIIHSKANIYECEYLNEDYYMLTYLEKRFETLNEENIKIVAYWTNEKNESIKIDSSIDFLKENFQIKENMYVFRLIDLL